MPIQLWTFTGEQEFKPLIFLDYTLISKKSWTCSGEQKFNPLLFLQYTLISRHFWTCAENRNLILCSSFSTHWCPDSSVHLLGNRICSSVLHSIHIDVQTVLNNCWGTKFIPLLFLHYILMTRQFWTCAGERNLFLSFSFSTHWCPDSSEQLLENKIYSSALPSVHIDDQPVQNMCWGIEFIPLLFVHYILISRHFWTTAGKQNLFFCSSFTTHWWTDSSEHVLGTWNWILCSSFTIYWWPESSEHVLGNRNLILSSSFTTHWYPGSS